MQETMDTDYGLPITMHRPFIGLDVSYDTPLPFRKDLKQVTQLSAENSTPYQLPQAHRNCDLLGQIYNFWFWDHCVGWKKQDFCAFFARDSRCGLLYVSRQIQAEVWDILLRKAVVTFCHPLSNRKIFWNNWEALYSTTDEYVPRKLERMAIASSAFEFMRRVELEHTDCNAAVERPHPWRIARKQMSFLSRLAQSLNFLAKHCPLLFSLHIEVVRIPTWSGNGVPFKKFKAVVVALRYLAEQCRDLRILGIMSHTVEVCAYPMGHIFLPECRMPGRQDYNLDVSLHPLSSSRRCRRGLVQFGLGPRGCRVQRGHQFVSYEDNYWRGDSDAIVASIMQEVEKLAALY